MTLIKGTTRESGIWGGIRPRWRTAVGQPPLSVSAVTPRSLHRVLPQLRSLFSLVIRAHECQRGERPLLHEAENYPGGKEWKFRLLSVSCQQTPRTAALRSHIGLLRVNSGIRTHKVCISARLEDEKQGKNKVCIKMHSQRQIKINSGAVLGHKYKQMQK